MEILIVIVLAAAYAIGRSTSSAHSKLVAMTSLRDAAIKQRDDLAAELGVAEVDLAREGLRVRESEEALAGLKEEALVEARLYRDEAGRAQVALRKEVAALSAKLERRKERADAAQAAFSMEKERWVQRAAKHRQDLDDAYGVVPVDPSAALAAHVASEYVAWCNRAAPLVGRYYMFERALRRTVPDAAVRPVYRVPGDGAAEFRTAAEGAEHWLLQFGDDRFLFPQPASADGFRELAPVFEGAAAPRTVGSVSPARLGADGDRLVVSVGGSVS